MISSLPQTRATVTNILSIVSLCLLCWIATPALAGSHRFKVENIRVTGLQKLSQTAVLNQLPIRSGEWFDISHSDEALKKLYETQWFDKVQLASQGARLEIIVKERPIIYQFIFTGGHDIPEDRLETILKSLGLVNGEFFNSSHLAVFKKILMEKCAHEGRHAAKVNSSVTTESEGRVKINVELIPGPILRFSAINLFGNRTFSKERLLAALPVSACRAWSVDSIWTFIRNKSGHCTQDTRDRALQALRLFYENQGYLDIKIDATRINITSDRREAEWMIELTEGPVYRVGGYRILGNFDEINENKLQKLIHFKLNGTYSKQALLQTKGAIKKYFDACGYMNAKVNIIPHVDRAKHLVSFAIQIDQGEKTYVRYIDIVGNRYTQDGLLRSLIMQQEASLVSQKALKESEQALLGSGFVQDATIGMREVHGTKDQVDLTVNVHETSRRASFAPNISWGKDGLIALVDAKCENLLGRGEDVGFKFSQDKEETSGYLSYQKKVSDIFGLRGATWGFEGYATSRGITKSVKNYFNETFSSIMTNINFIKSNDKKESESITKSSLLTASKERSSSPSNGHAKGFQTTKRSQYQREANGGRFDLDFPKDRLSRSLRVGAEFKSNYLSPPEEEKEHVIEIKKFLERYGPKVDQWILRGGLSINRVTNLNLFFPTRGQHSNLLLSIALSGVGQSSSENSFRSPLAVRSDKKNALNYWKLDYSGFHFWNCAAYKTTQHVFGVQWRLGLGHQFSKLGNDLPFFDNYHSGRFLGFKDDSLGPRDSLDQSLGGSLLVKARAMYCLPKPFSGDYLHFLGLSFPYRSSFFCQVGNVYDNVYSLIEDLQRGGTALPCALSVGVACEVGLRLPMLGELPVFASIACPVLNNSLANDKKNAEYLNFGISFLSD